MIALGHRFGHNRTVQTDTDMCAFSYHGLSMRYAPAILRQLAVPTWDTQTNSQQKKSPCNQSTSYPFPCHTHCLTSNGNERGL